MTIKVLRTLWLATLGILSIVLGGSDARSASLPQADEGFQLRSRSQPDSNDVEEADEIEQVTSVSQLTDVQPTDWAFQALQSLVERYGCIVGYPDRTYKGNQALNRYEFAAGLNACLNKINELIAASTADLVKKEDLVEVDPQDQTVFRG